MATVTALLHTLSCPHASVLQVAGVQPPKRVVITYKPDADSKAVQASCSCPSRVSQVLRSRDFYLVRPGLVPSSGVWQDCHFEMMRHSRHCFS